MKERTCSFFRLKHWDNAVCVRCIYNRSHWTQRCQTHEPKPNKHTQWALSLILYSGRFHPVLVGRCYCWETHIHTVQLCVCDGGPIKWSHGQLCPLHHPTVPMVTSDKLLAMPSAIWKKIKHTKKLLFSKDIVMLWL